MSSALKRVITALVAVPVVISLTILGGWAFVTGVAVTGALAQREFYRLVEPDLDLRLMIIGVLAGVAATFHAIFPEAVWICLLLVTAAIAALPLVGKASGRQAVTVSAGIIYPVIFLSLLTDIRLGTGLPLPDTDLIKLTIAFFLLIWTTDTAAYLVGSAIGKRPLAPHISPGKTVEGIIGGVVGAVAVAAVLKMMLTPFLDWPDAAALAIICGAISPLGDLAESQIKRSAGVKDSSHLLPGHGGVLDRIDALLVAVPLCYLYLRFVGL